MVASSTVGSSQCERHAQPVFVMSHGMSLSGGWYATVCQLHCRAGRRAYESCWSVFFHEVTRSLEKTKQPKLFQNRRLRRKREEERKVRSSLKGLVCLQFVSFSSIGLLPIPLFRVRRLGAVSSFFGLGANDARAISDSKGTNEDVESEDSADSAEGARNEAREFAQTC